MKLNVPEKRPNKWPTWVKRSLEVREGNLCAKCKGSFATLESDPTIDHIIPLAKGGSNDSLNLQLLCSSCYLKKSKKN